MSSCAYGTTPTSYQFTGQRNDSSIGLYFYNARYYDPALGRFIQADTIVPSPANPQTLNRYTYALNNPLRYTDPSGHFPFAALALVAGIAFIADFVVQATNNYQQGMEPLEAVYYPNINWGQTAGNVVDSALTFTLYYAVGPSSTASPGTRITGGALAGGTSSVIGEFTGRNVENLVNGMTGDPRRADLEESYSFDAIWGAGTAGVGETLKIYAESQIAKEALSNYTDDLLGQWWGYGLQGHDLYHWSSDPYLFELHRNLLLPPSSETLSRYAVPGTVAGVRTCIDFLDNIA